MVDGLAAPSDPATEGVLKSSWFDRASTWIVAGALMMGALRALEIVLDNVQHGVVGVLFWIDVLGRAGYAIIGHGLAGLVLAALVRALGIGVRGFAERPMAESPRRAFVPEHEPQTGPKSPTAPAESPARAADEDLAAVRRLIEAADWDEADARVADLIAEHPDDRRVERIADDLRRAKQTVGERWTEQLRAAREVNDPNRVLELYAQTPPVHDEEGRRLLDQDVAKWFLSLVHRRLRGGGIQLEIVTLAERVSESFAHTIEGASLRAALPTLRRSVGLCPRCARPYTGTAEACPECLAGKTATTEPEAEAATATATATAAAEDEAEVDEFDDLMTESRDSEWFAERDGDDSPA